jgi:hypothetical protein
MAGNEDDSGSESKQDSRGVFLVAVLCVTLVFTVCVCGAFVRVGAVFVVAACMRVVCVREVFVAVVLFGVVFFVVVFFGVVVCFVVLLMCCAGIVVFRRMMVVFVTTLGHPHTEQCDHADDQQGYRKPRSVSTIREHGREPRERKRNQGRDPFGLVAEEDRQTERAGQG